MNTTIRNVGALFTALSIFSVLSVADDSIKITRQVRPSGVKLDGVTVEVVDRGIQPGHIKSFISLKIKGRFSGGWCAIKDLAARITPAQDPAANFRNSHSNLELVGLDTNQQVDLGDKACADGTSSSFELPARLEVGGWGADQTSQTWRYTLSLAPLPRQPKRSMDILVTYKANGGWQVSTEVQPPASDGPQVNSNSTKKLPAGSQGTGTTTNDANGSHTGN